MIEQGPQPDACGGGDLRRSMRFEGIARPLLLVLLLASACGEPAGDTEAPAGGSTAERAKGAAPAPVAAVPPASAEAIRGSWRIDRERLRELMAAEAAVVDPDPQEAEAGLRHAAETVLPATDGLVLEVGAETLAFHSPHGSRRLPYQVDGIDDGRVLASTDDGTRVYLLAVDGDRLSFAFPRFDRHLPFVRAGTVPASTADPSGPPETDQPDE